MDLQREAGPSEERLDEIERSRAMWEAEMEALVAQAKGTYQAANNAESRTRTMAKHYEKLSDPLDLEGEEVETPISERYAPRGEEEGLQPMRVAVAPDHKQNALRFKFS